jgi:hypothetical protein
MSNTKWVEPGETQTVPKDEMKNQFLFILKNYVTKEQFVEIQNTLNELNKSNANKLVESKAIQVIIV